jgi:hypothetical protein
MAKGLSWVAILLAVMTVVLFVLMGLEEPGSQGPAVDLSPIGLSLYTGLLAPIVAVAGLLLAKRGGKRAPRLARIALAFAIGAFSWPLLFLGPLLLGGGY